MSTDTIIYLVAGIAFWALVLIIHLRVQEYNAQFAGGLDND
jgi:hypothetical protein